MNVPHSLSQPVRADSSLREGAKGASHQGTDKPRRLRRSGRLRASPTVGSGNRGLVPFNEQTPPPHVRSAPPLPGEARVLRTRGRIRASPTDSKDLGNRNNVPHSLSQPVRADSSLREGAKGASHQREAKLPHSVLKNPLSFWTEGEIFRIGCRYWGDGGSWKLPGFWHPAPRWVPDGCCRCDRFRRCRFRPGWGH